MINAEDLDTIIQDVTWSYEESGEKVPQNILDTLNEIKQIQSILNEYNVTPKTLREVLLTGQMFRNQPTLDECIKEWEEKNAQIKMNHKHLLTIYLPHKDIDKYIIVINFWKTSKQYDTHIYDTEERNVYPADISFEIHDLIHKTLKALEEMKDE